MTIMRFLILLALFISVPAFAGTGVTTAQPVQGYMVMQGQNVVPIFQGANGIPNTSGAFGSLNTALNGTPAHVSPPPAATANNPTGYTPVMSGGQPVMQSSIPVSVSPPVGAAPSAANAAAAGNLAGAGAGAAGAILASVPLGTGAGSLAVQLGMNALGLGAALTLGGGNPLFVVPAAYAVGMSGYALWNAMNAQGIKASPSGSLVKETPFLDSPPSGYIYSLTGSNTGAGTGYNFEALLNQYLGTPNSGGYLANKGGGLFVMMQFCCGAGTQYSAQNYLVPAPADFVPPPPPTVPVTPKHLVDAMVAATADPIIAMDAAAAAVAGGVDIEAAIVASGSPVHTSALRLASAFTQLSTSIDALGNSTALLQRTVIDIPAGVAPQTPVMDLQSVPVVNGAPQKVDNTSLAPSIAANIASAAGTALDKVTQSDLCVQHPDALACSNDAALGDVPLAPLTVQNLAISLTPVAVPSMAACPAPITVGLGKVFDFFGICSFLVMLKPLLLAFAWLAAGAMVFRGRPYA